MPSAAAMAEIVMPAALSSFTRSRCLLRCARGAERLPGTDPRTSFMPRRCAIFATVGTETRATPSLAMARTTADAVSPDISNSRMRALISSGMTLGTGARLDRPHARVRTVDGRILEASACGVLPIRVLCCARRCGARPAWGAGAVCGCPMTRETSAQEQACKAGAAVYAEPVILEIPASRRAVSHA